MIAISDKNVALDKLWQTGPVLLLHFNSKRVRFLSQGPFKISFIIHS